MEQQEESVIREGGVFEVQAEREASPADASGEADALAVRTGLAAGDDGCPNGRNPLTGGCYVPAGCFITTACVQAQGLPDDCVELETLRAFRDGHVLRLDGGEALVADYYAHAPAIVAAIDRRPDADAIYAGLYERLVARSVDLIRAGEADEAVRHGLEVYGELKARYLK